MKFCDKVDQITKELYESCLLICKAINLLTSKNIGKGTSLILVFPDNLAASDLQLLLLLLLVFYVKKVHCLISVLLYSHLLSYTTLVGLKNSNLASF